jgi:hypothetical protein
MIDTPSQFAPKSELQDFLKQMAAHKDQDNPQVKEAVQEVQGHLMRGPLVVAPLPKAAFLKKPPDQMTAMERLAAETIQRLTQSTPLPAAPSASATASSMPAPSRPATPTI